MESFPPRIVGRFRSIVAAALLVTAVTLLSGYASASHTYAKPNIVFILLDDVGYGSLGSYGGQEYFTPNIDTLAAEGMRFTNYYASATICSPSRVAILTGLYPARLGVRTGLSDPGPGGIPDRVAVLPQLLWREGYRTGHFGKWHVGRRHPEYRPMAKGYDESVTMVADRDVTGEWILRYEDPDLYVDDTGPIRHSGHQTEILTDYAIDFISRHRDEPFFVNLWYFAAHSPYQAPAEWTARFPATPAGAYAAVIAHADEQIGRLLAKLQELSLENTLVVLTSDNGGTYIRDRFVGNGPLAGGKFTHFEGGIKVPMIVRWPAFVAPGSVFDGIVASFDFYPTLATLAGVNDELVSGDGRNFATTLLSSGAIHLPSEDRALFWGLEVRESAVLGYPHAANSYAVRKGNWKLLVNEYRDGSTDVSLFDLKTDPGEQVDLFGARTRYVVASLLEERRQFKTEVTHLPLLIGQVKSTDGPSGLQLVTDRRLEAGTDFSAFARINVSPEHNAAGLPAVLLTKERSWTLWLTEDRYLRLTSAGGPGHEIFSVAPLEPDRWYDIGFTINFSDPARVFRDVTLYVEGESPVAAPRVIGLGSEYPVFINNNEAETRPFRGILEDVRFFVSALTADEVVALFGGEAASCPARRGARGICGARLRRPARSGSAP